MKKERSGERRHEENGREGEMERRSAGEKEGRGKLRRCESASVLEVTRWLDTVDFGKKTVLVRINALDTPHWEQDLAATLRTRRPDMFMVPKVSARSDSGASMGRAHVLHSAWVNGARPLQTRSPVNRKFAPGIGRSDLGVGRRWVDFGGVVWIARRLLPQTLER